MNTIKKRAIGLLLALAMLLSLAACGKNDDDAQQLSGTVYVPQFIDLNLESLGQNYNLQGGCTDGTNVYLLVSIYPDDDAGEAGEMREALIRVPLDGGEMAELEGFQHDASRTMEGYDQVSSYLNGIRIGADGSLWVEESVYAAAYDLPEDFDPETDQMWNYEQTESVSLEYQIQLDSTGTEITRIDISNLAEKAGIEGGLYADGSLFDKDGDLIVSADRKLVVLDPSMNVRFTLEDENMWGGNVVALSDGSVGVMTTVNDTVNQTYTRQLRCVDKAAKKWGEAYDLPQNAYEVYPGGGEYLFYYKNGETLYGYRAEVEEGAEHGERLLSWLDADIDSDSIQFFSFLADGRVVVMTRSWYGSGGPEVNLAILTATPRSELPEKTILTYATMYLGQDERNRIIDFNKNSTTHRIEVTDYSEYATEEDYMAGITKLNTEILAGSVPDIIGVSNLPLRQYGAKGILEDLWPFIDNDADISREKLMDRVLNAAEQDGKLYQVFGSFTIQTIIGSSKVVGEDMGWTMQEFQDALASMPDGCTPFGEGTTKTGMLSAMLNQNLDSFVNWETGECSFDGDSFKTALAFCNQFPAEFDYENYEYNENDSDPARIADGRQMLMQQSLNDFRSIQMYEAMFGGPEALNHFYLSYDYSGGSGGYSVVVMASASGGSFSADRDSQETNRLIPGRYITFKGYPMEDGSCGSSFSISDGLAMSSTCKDKEAAWSFMRQLLLPTDEEDGSFGYRWGFPVNKADFDKMAEESMEVEYITDGEGNQVLDENGNPIQQSKGGWGWATLDIDTQATTQGEYDQIMELYNAIDSLYSYDTKISEIVSDVAGSYFAGDKSLEETADLIQNRVKTYVNESR